jgi:hypothetical protein
MVYCNITHTSQKVRTGFEKQGKNMWSKGPILTKSHNAFSFRPLFRVSMRSKVIDKPQELVRGITTSIVSTNPSDTVASSSIFQQDSALIQVRIIDRVNTISQEAIFHRTSVAFVIPRHTGACARPIPQVIRDAKIDTLSHARRFFGG